MYKENEKKTYTTHSLRKLHTLKLKEREREICFGKLKIKLSIKLDY